VPEPEAGRVGELLRDVEALYPTYGKTIRAEIQKTIAAGVEVAVLEKALARTLAIKPHHPVGFLRERVGIEGRIAAENAAEAQEIEAHEARKREALASLEARAAELVAPVAQGMQIPTPMKAPALPIEKPRLRPPVDPVKAAREAAWGTEDARGLIRQAFSLAGDREDQQTELARIRHSGSPADMRELVSRWQATDGPRPDDAKPDLNAGSGGHSGRALKSRGGDEDDACNH